MNHHKLITVFFSIVLAFFSAQSASAEEIPKENSAAERQFVTITGVVHTPGRIPWKPDLTLLIALITAGGPDGMPKVFIIRGKERIAVSIKAIKRKQVPDPKLQPGDKVEVLQGSM